MSIQHVRDNRKIDPSQGNRLQKLPQAQEKETDEQKKARK